MVPEPEILLINLKSVKNLTKPETPNNVLLIRRRLLSYRFGAFRQMASCRSWQWHGTVKIVLGGKERIVSWCGGFHLVQELGF